MMRPGNDGPEVFLCRDPVDFRKGINGLAALVEAEMGQDPFAERLFVFCNRRRNRVKILYWERNGFCLWQKRLEEDRFHWPRRWRDEVITLSAQQLNWLLDGYDILNQMTPFIGHLPLEHVHDGTVKPFIDHEIQRGMSPKTINNAIGVIATVLKRAASKWRTEDGLPWLRHAPPILTRLSLVGKRRRPYPLSWEEQDALLRCLPRHLVDPVLFAVNTGCREQEICGLRWDWEVKVPELETLVFVLPETETKTRTERIVVLNSIAHRIVEARREQGSKSGFVFEYRGKRLGTLRTSAWRRAWTHAGLPEDSMVMKGVHNLRHTCGRRLRGAGVSLETRKLLLGHASGDITTHYSAAEIGELIAAAERITNRGRSHTPSLAILNGRRPAVGKVSEGF